MMKIHEINGNKYQFVNNKLELFNEEIENQSNVPIMEESLGSKRWYLNGQLHRVDGPAIDGDGNKEWYFNGKLHRLDGPAMEFADGHKKWYINGIRHREDGPAVEWANGSKAWYDNGQLHRLDGPAIEYADGSKYWCVNGQLHRLDGPAKIVKGKVEYYISGIKLTEEQFKEITGN